MYSLFTISFLVKSIAFFCTFCILKYKQIAFDFIFLLSYHEYEGVDYMMIGIYVISLRHSSGTRQEIQYCAS